MLVDGLVFLLLAATFFSSAYQIAQLELCYRYWKDVLFGSPKETPSFPAGDFPFVTVQLPMFNESAVARRLIGAVAALDYPRDRFEVQVLDDSTDGSTEVVEAAVSEARSVSPDLQIERISRNHRVGFKAGALQAGLRIARGEYVAIFDADFVPSADFLKQTLPWFAEPQIAVVQSRWGHLNARESIVTSFQEYFLDGHHSVEQRGRNAGGYFMNFNGTAGVWRRRAIDDAGGWQNDTIVEDMDLSYRAQLNGWRMFFLEDYVTPGELPGSILAFRVQLFRWFEGYAQVTRKLLGSVLRSRQPLRVKIQACNQLLVPLSVAMALLVTVLNGLMPALLALSPGSGRYVGLSLIGFTWLPFVLLVFGTPRIRFDRGPVIPRLVSFTARTVVFLAAMAGLTGQCAVAVIRGLIGRQGEWSVTPKGKRGTAATGSANRGDRLPGYVLLDLPIIAYLICAIAISIAYRTYVPIAFQSVWLAGYLWLFTSSWREIRASSALKSQDLKVQQRDWEGHPTTRSAVGMVRD